MTARNQSASLARRLAFAGSSYHLFDKLFCSQPLARVSRIGDSQTARIPDHMARIAFDLFESARLRRWAPEIGNAELALLHATDPMPQHPRYLSYWHDPSLGSMVGMIVGIDLIRHNGKYYVIELNHGPAIYPRRRQMYDAPFDPLFSGLFDSAVSDGFRKIVMIAFNWDPIYVEEFARASLAYGMPIVPYNCPLKFPACPNRMFGLPDPLEPKTLYAVHGGLFTPPFRYLDNKWYASKWLNNAIRNEMPRETLVALPATHDNLVFPIEDHGPRWPNLVVKLAASARSIHVIAARFESLDEARKTLGVYEDGQIPKTLRSGFLNGTLFYGREHVLYQAYVPPELDENDHAQMLRLHIFVSPLRTMYLSAHTRISRKPIPERAPCGIIPADDAYVFNNADYALLTPETEADMRSVAADLGAAMQRAIVRKFQTGPAQANISVGSTTAIR
jgi:hypothetical protein